MSDQITALQIDEEGLPPASPEAEQERNIAIFDLLEGNEFKLAQTGTSGPYSMMLRRRERQLVFEVTPQTGEAAEFSLPVSGFRKRAREYFEVCDSYFEAVRVKSPDEIARLDEGRKTLHNDGAEYLGERLAPFAALDSNSLRRLFTLLCSLAYRG